VIVAQVSFEHLLHVPDLLVGAFLSRCKFGKAIGDVPKPIGDLAEVVGDVLQVAGDVPHDARQADEPIRETVGLF
jgi:hypothetical protein